MLAEPRRKIRYALDPQGSAWSKDKSKVGQKLLEKMGWTQGKGLGANENGMTEHIKLKQRQDNAGVGFTRKYDDNWLEHQDGFNDLLATLGTAKTGSPTSKADGASLMEKSEQSRARVHYHKFVKGKDLSQYTHEDLHNILGTRKIEKKKKKLEEEKKASEPSSPKENGRDTSPADQTFQSAVNMKEYFAAKMKAMRNPGDGQRGEEETSPRSVDSPMAAMTTGCQERQRESDGPEESSPSSKRKKKKKSKRVKHEATEAGSDEGASLLPAPPEDGQQIPQQDGADETPEKRRKSRKRKHSPEDAPKEDGADSSAPVSAASEAIAEEGQEATDGNESRKKKKKKKKKKEKETEEVEVEAEEVEVEAVTVGGSAGSSSSVLVQCFKGSIFQSIHGYSAYKVFSLEQEKTLYEEKHETKKKKMAVRRLEEEGNFFA